MFAHYFSLTPLYEIVTSGDESYSKASMLLENLKNALMDVNDIRNEPIILKIQSNYTHHLSPCFPMLIWCLNINVRFRFLADGSISMTDFLNDTTKFKQKLSNYGLDPRISDAFLKSKIKIIEVNGLRALLV